MSHPLVADVFSSIPLLANLPASAMVTSVRTGETLDRAEMAQRVAKEQMLLLERLPQASNRVVIGIHDPLACLVSLFATWATGNCAVLVNPLLSDDEKARVTAKVKASLWIDDTGIHGTERTAAREVACKDAALILMTSGTTGDPKGVTHSLETLEARLKLNVEEIGAEVLANTLCTLPLFFGHGLIGNCLTGLYAGQHVYILENPDLKDFANLGPLIDRYDISFFSSVPSMWRLILRLSRSPEKSPRRVHVGSAPLTGELWSEIETWCGTEEVFNTYGMTETANWISGGKRPKSNADGFVGTPWGGEFRVMVDGDLMQEGRGEVFVISPTLMLGLWNADGTLSQCETPFPTGDIGELRADQSLRLVGREKNEINRAGVKVLAEEVDMLLERHPDVVEACAFGIPDPASGEAVGAVVTLRAGADVSEAEIVEWCRSQARRDAVPYRLAIVGNIEKNDRGKLARNKLQKKMTEHWR